MLENLECTGNESNLLQCSHRSYEVYSYCDHTEDASVTCNGKIRLMSGSNMLEGIVEVYHNNTWGTVCNDGWDLLDAKVVCKEMGFPSANSTATPHQFGETSSTPVVSRFGCTGDETDIDDCDKEWTTTCAGLGEGPEVGPAGVVCTRPIRLVGGNSEMEGRVEVFDISSYGTMCDDGWDMNAARVVCKQLGSYVPIEANRGSRYGTSVTPINLIGVRCSGEEDTLEQCNHAGWNAAPSSCTGDTLAGVVCTRSSVRLASDSDMLSGKAELYLNNQWGKICADGWDDKDATVFCQQLGGYPISENCCGDAPPMSGDTMLVTNVICDGNELSLQECTYTEISQRGCSGNIATVTCQPSLRLTSTNETSGDLMGNVEVWYNGAWGNVCDKFWDHVNAMVVCRQLGDYDAVDSFCCDKFGGATSSFHLDDVVCTGFESKLDDCYHSPWGTATCYPWEIAGVSCRQIRLVSEKSTPLHLIGRVEILKNRQWGRICGENWGQEEANVLCRELHNTIAEPLGEDFGAGDLPVFYTNVRCNGDETNILDCQVDPGSEATRCSRDAFVVCKGNLRLSGGPTALEGRVEILFNGLWGAICDDEWDLKDAKVVCKQLGNYAALAGKCCDAYGRAYAPIYLNRVGCNGKEENLANCPSGGWDSYYCPHYASASVACTELRLSSQNGTLSINEHQGRVDVWQNGQWKSICSTSFDLQDADVVCRQLFSTNALATKKFLPSADAVIGISGLACTGDESLLMECEKDSDNAIDCSSSYAAGVVCKDIRLIGGSNKFEGAVEILHNSQWGLICGDRWDMANGEAACRQLGFCAPVNTQKGWNPPISEKDEMHWYGINCSGKEERLRDCQFHDGSSPCNSYHFEAAVVCGSGCEKPSSGGQSQFRHGSFNPDLDIYAKGAFITFTCEDDYELIGNAELMCQSDCAWSSMPPECQRKNPLPRVDNKDEGIKQGDTSTSTCDSDGCENPFAGGQSQFQHGSFNPDLGIYAKGAFITFTCEDDYDLIGNAELMCQSDCAWSSMPPECQSGSWLLFLVGLLVGAIGILVVILVIWRVRVHRINQQAETFILSDASSFVKPRPKGD